MKCRKCGEDMEGHIAKYNRERDTAHEFLDYGKEGGMVLRLTNLHKGETPRYIELGVDFCEHCEQFQKLVIVSDEKGSVLS